MMSSSSTGGGRCSACRYLRRRCPSDCIFSPYFPANDPQKFACVHRIYGASNVTKMLQQLPEQLRGQAADALSFEARHRIQDPVYGCVGIIHRLHQEIHNAETQLAKARAELAVLINSHSQQPQLQREEIQPIGSSVITISLPRQGNVTHFGPHHQT